MAKRGLIFTEQSTSDKRGTVVTGTKRGNVAFRDARRGHVALVRDLFFRGLSDDSLAGLTEGLEHVYANIVERGSERAGTDN